MTFNDIFDDILEGGPPQNPLLGSDQMTSSMTFPMTFWSPPLQNVIDDIIAASNDIIDDMLDPPPLCHVIDDMVRAVNDIIDDIVGPPRMSLMTSFGPPMTSSMTFSVPGNVIDDIVRAVNDIIDDIFGPRKCH